MVVGELAESADLLVVGAGPGGYVAAARAAQLGRTVTVVDRGAPEGGLGGACLHVGCIPSKALIELAGAYEHARRPRVGGLELDGARVDLPAFQAWKRAIVERLATGVENLLAAQGVELVTGALRFNKPDQAVVALPDGQSRYFEFEQALIATGSRPASLAPLPFDGERVLTSTDVLGLDRVPGSLAVVGAGYIGLEIGQALAKLGSQVSVIEAADRVLPALDEALAEPVMRGLARLGVEVHLSSVVVGLDGDDLAYANEEGRGTVPAERVLVAIGRVPNTDDLGLPAVGVPVDDAGLIAVDERMLASASIAAIGDVTSGPALAHRASAQGIVAAEALSGVPAAFDPAGVPAIVFTDPEIASVGLTEQQARAGGFDVAVTTVPLAASGRAATIGEDDGFTRVVADRSDDRVLGVQMVGPHASELIAEATLAIEMVASPEDLRGTIHPHPTLSEGLHAAAARLAPRPARR
jgi:dihydrolipoyl dehydrogenase